MTSRVPEPSAEVLAAVLKLTTTKMEISVSIKTIQLQEGDPSKTALIGAA
jgi:hypothetical protein